MTALKTQPRGSQSRNDIVLSMKNSSSLASAKLQQTKWDWEQTVETSLRDADPVRRPSQLERGVTPKLACQGRGKSRYPGFPGITGPPAVLILGAPKSTRNVDSPQIRVGPQQEKRPYGEGSTLSEFPHPELRTTPKWPRMLFNREGHIFVNGARTLPEALPESLGCDEAHNVPESNVRYIEEETRNGILQIKYPFQTYRCLGCWEGFVTPQALVAHIDSKHPKSFIEYRCGICNKSMPSIKGIAIHYGKCKRGQTGKGARTGKSNLEIPGQVSSVGESETLVINDNPLTRRHFAYRLTNVVMEDQVAQQSPTRVDTGVNLVPHPLDEGALEHVDDNIVNPVTELPVGDTPADAQVPCEECDAHFNTKRGLGQHIRFAHPNLANKKREAAYVADKDRKRDARRRAKQSDPAHLLHAETHTDVRPPSVPTQGKKLAPRSAMWTIEEDELIAELNKVFKSDRLVNVRIFEQFDKVFPGKSAMKIKSRRRVLLEYEGKDSNRTNEKGGASGSTITTPTDMPQESQEEAIQYTQIDKTAFGEAIITGSNVATVAPSSRMLEKALAGEDVSTEMSELFNTLKISCKREKKTTVKTKSQTIRNNHVPKTKPGSARAKGVRHKFREHQSLYTRDRKRLAQLIFDGEVNDAKCELEPEVVEATYMDRFGGTSQEVNLSAYPKAEHVDNALLMQPITEEEVREAYGRANKDTATGPDLIDLRRLTSEDRRGHMSANLFNTWMVQGKVPQEIKASRSILLPKTKEGLDQIGNWRPLTISSVILRLYTSILAMRVQKAIELNPRQRGFIAAPGCSENGYLLGKIIEHSKSQKNELCVAFLDLAKAFDTISHVHIVKGLQRFGICDHFVGIVRDLYLGASTSFATAKGNTGDIPLTRGVKQGDPLSPLLFNIAMDPLLAEISKQNNGYKFGTCEEDRIEALAYADDNSLLAGSTTDMNRNLHIVDDFCNATGMRLNVKKSAAFNIVPLGKTYLVNKFDTPLIIGDEKVPLIQPEGSMKYLGSSISPWITVVRKNLVKPMAEMLKKIGKAPLKPRQKLEMLTTYALPRISFPLINQKYSVGTLKDLDACIRRNVKEWFHLASCTTNNVLYSPNSEGGLGIPELCKSVPAGRIDSLRRISRSSDPKIRRMAAVFNIQEEIEFYAESAGLKVPTKPQGKTKWKHLAKKHWRTLTCAGRGRRYLERSETNTWCAKNAGYFSEPDFISALKLRTDTYPCKAVMARAGRPSDALCRRCNQSPETIGHISGRCPSVKNYRIKRHNVVTQVIADRVKQAGWFVTMEPIIKDENNQAWKPDLICVKGNKAVVIDPTIVLESKNSLDIANTTKIRKYTHLSQKVREAFSVEEVDVRGFAIGALGGWCSANDDTLKMLGIGDKGLAGHLSRLAFKGTINLVHLFMDM